MAFTGISGILQFRSGYGICFITPQLNHGRESTVLSRAVARHPYGRRELSQPSSRTMPEKTTLSGP